MSYLLRIDGEDEQIEEIRRQLLVDNMTVSETHRVNVNSKQRSAPWTAPETIEILKFVTALLQTSGAGLTLLLVVRNALKEGQSVVVGRKDSGAQLKIQKDTPDETLKEFAERDTPARK